MSEADSYAGEVSLDDLRHLRKNIVRVFEKLNLIRLKQVEKESSDQCEIDTISELGTLLKIYWEFHRRTNGMLPDRITDFSETSVVIMGLLSEEKKSVLRSCFENDVVFSVDAIEKMNTVPCLPFLSVMTIRRLTLIKHQFEAPNFRRFPSRR